MLLAVGLRAEAALLPHAPHLRPVCAGGDPVRLEAALRRAAPGAGGVLSLGIAGGLDPALPPGALVVASAVHRPDRPPLPADPAWAAAILRACVAAGRPARLGPLAGAGAVAADPAAKAALRARTGGLAVDLESAAAARLAAELGLPFAALRAVADPAGATLPPAAVHGLTPEGDPDVARVLRALLRRPGDLGGLLRAAWWTRVAMRALAGVARAGGEWHRPPPGGTAPRDPTDGASGTGRRRWDAGGTGRDFMLGL